MHTLRRLNAQLRRGRSLVGAAGLAASLTLAAAGAALAAQGGAPDGATAPAEGARYGSTDLTASARLLAGIEPKEGAAQLQAVAQTEAWRAHRKASRYGDRQLRARLEHMDRWQKSALPAPSADAALIYPFSGPDFINAYALFPDYKTYVFFSLEPPGPVPPLARMDEPQLGELFSDLRGALNDLVALNFFITPNMKENLHTDSLQGTVPVLLAQMGMLGLTVDRVEPYRPWPAAARARSGKPALPMSAVRIDFKDARHRPRTLLYLSLDVSDGQLGFYPQFASWLGSFDQPAVLLKSASYLLHGRNFRKVRAVLRDHAHLIVQDDTGMPYRILRDAGFQISLFGQYEKPVKLFENRYQKDLDDAFASSGNTDPVPFPFGYNWRKEGRSGVIVALRQP